MGTAGGLYHFRDQIARTFGSETSSFFVLNSDVCCDFPLSEMIALQRQSTNGTGFVIMGTKVCLCICVCPCCDVCMCKCCIDYQSTIGNGRGGNF